MATIDQLCKKIQQHAKRNEEDAGLIHIIREKAKTDSGRLTDFGRNFIVSSMQTGMRQIDIAKILDVTPSAVNQNAAKLKDES